MDNRDTVITVPYRIAVLAKALHTVIITSLPDVSVPADRHLLRDLSIAADLCIAIHGNIMCHFGIAKDLGVAAYLCTAAGFLAACYDSIFIDMGLAGNIRVSHLRISINDCIA